jgi:hypothetical protein
MIICCDVSFTQSDDSRWRLWIYQGMPKLIWACHRVEMGWPTKALCGVICGILMLLWVCNAICVIWRHWAILVFSSWCVALAFSNGVGKMGWNAEQLKICQNLALRVAVRGH